MAPRDETEFVVSLSDPTTNKPVAGEVAVFIVDKVGRLCEKFQLF